MKTKLLSFFKSPLVVTQFFGENPAWYPMFLGHEGIDCVPEDLTDKTIVSLFNGTVLTDVDAAPGPYGNHIRIYYPAISSIVWFCHLKENYVEHNQLIYAGEEIGLMGNSGRSYGEHVHFSVAPVNSSLTKRLFYKNGYKGLIDPMHVLRVCDY